MTEANRFTLQEWESRLEGIDLEIARQALLCKVRLLAPGVIERVLSNDECVCGAHHPVAFKTLRGLLAMHFLEEKHLSEALGAEQASEVASQIRAHLERTLGHEIGHLIR